MGYGSLSCTMCPFVCFDNIRVRNTTSVYVVKSFLSFPSFIYHIVVIVLLIQSYLHLIILHLLIMFTMYLRWNSSFERIWVDSMLHVTQLLNPHKINDSFALTNINNDVGSHHLRSTPPILDSGYPFATPNIQLKHAKFGPERFTKWH